MAEREAEGRSTREARSLLVAAAGGAAAVAPMRLGERVRALRQARNWTLQEAARRAGVARSTLSKIENEQMSPSFEVVRKLARGLGVDVPQLFRPATGDRLTGRRALTRAGAGEPHPTPTYEHEMLAPELVSKRMLPYRTVVRARGFDEFDDWIRHEGEEFLYVLSGAVRFFTEHYAPVDLATGDSVYYDAQMGHVVISTSPEDAAILWVTSL